MKEKIFLKEMVKSNIKKRTWKAIYRLLDRVSPVAFDCGSICGAICCNPEEFLSEDSDIKEEDIGIYLFPGEEKLHSLDDQWISWSFEDAEDYFPSSWKGNVGFIKCKTPPKCPRVKRPLQCRTYPLYPYLDKDNKLSLIYYPHRTPYSCPIIYNNMDIDEGFKKATYTVWKRLIEDELIFDLVKEESLELDGFNLEIIYP